jgi:2-polyprenyl-6-methoxyphenol hydroxylase-like FAD-dependent oxidoreductase
MMDSASEPDVVIVGAGPTGLALGAELRRLGVPALILDKQPAGANTSRACVVHARTLEVLEPLGATAELLQEGLVVPVFRVRHGCRILANVSFKDLDTKYPFTLMSPQDWTEAILLRRLEALGGGVERPSIVTGVLGGEHDVQVKFSSGGEEKAVRAKWVVGCDGMHSMVREQARIPFEGGAYQESFVLADVQMDWPLDRQEVSLFFSGKGIMLVAPLPPGDRFRVVATMEDAPAEPSVADFEALLMERGPDEGVVSIRRMLWSSRFHIQHRVVRGMRRGRILLAGDAAHVHSPAGGQGMNTGIQDAISLAGALAATLESGEDAALAEWEEKRLKIAHSVVKMTDRMTQMATASSPAVQTLRNVAVEIIGNIPFAEHALAQSLSELDNR